MNSMTAMQTAIKADEAAKVAGVLGKVEQGKLFAVRIAPSKGLDSVRGMVKRLGGQWEPVSKLWVLRADLRNVESYALIARPGVQVLSGIEYKRHYDAARV